MSENGVQKLLPVIKWSGSKRSQAARIVNLFPDFEEYYEPFLGGGSVLIQTNAKTAICGDICKPLIDFWKTVKKDPARLITEYESRWTRLQNEGSEAYYDIRKDFNQKQNPHDLLFLSRTSQNGLIRFNQKGDFNSSFHHTRNGIKPDALQKIIFRWSDLIQNCKFMHGDYTKTTDKITNKDFVYMDPPYVNTEGMYYGKINYDDFADYLEELSSKNIRFALSGDGQSGSKKYSNNLPKRLFKRKLLLESGNSSFKNVIGRQVQKVKEALYLNF